MPLIRAQKEALIEKLTSEVGESRIALIVAYTRLHMKANDELRTKAFDQGAKIKMISNNLLTLLLKKLGRAMELPQKTLAVAYGYQDEVEAAKSLVTFGKETEALEVLGGWIDGTFFDMSAVKTLSSLPSKETLQAQLVGRLNGIIGSLAYSLNYPLQKFVYVVDAVKSAQPAVAVAPPAEEAATPETVTEAEEPTNKETEITAQASPDEAGESAEMKEEEKDEAASADRPVDDGIGRTEATDSAMLDSSAVEEASEPINE